MIFPPPPLIREHDRTAHEIAADVMRRLGASAGQDPLRDALVTVFAHYAELLVARLNRVPALHERAFFTCLGRSPAPPAPAGVALLFSPVPGPGPAPTVPRHTQVAAPPAPGDSEPVVFETSADLELVCARLERALAVDGQAQQARPIDLATPGGQAPPLPAEALPVARAMHIAQPLVLDVPGLSELRVQVEVDPGAALPAGSAPEWGIATEGAFLPLSPQPDGTLGLSRSGELVFPNLPPWPERALAGIAARWLSCRLRPATGAATARAAASAAPAVRITRLSLAGGAVLAACAPERAFHGAMALDASSDFFPFGERPRFGDMLFVGADAFALPGAQVALDITLANPAGAADAPIAPVTRIGKPVLRWEVYTLRGWTAVAADDATEALCASAQVRLTIPGDAVRTQVNGIDGGWLRVRLVAGSYLSGPAPAPPGLPAMAPPAIANLSVGASLRRGPVPAARVVLEHSFEYSLLEGAAAQAYMPFPPPEVRGAALYLGLAAREEALAGRTLRFFASPADSGQRLFVRDLAETSPLVRWEVRGRRGWRACSVVDHTEGMRVAGILELTLGGDIAPWPDSTLDPQQRLFWLRALWDAPEPALPRLRYLGLNAVPALQQLTLEHEPLGSGTGRPGQSLRTARRPVIGEFVLEVGVPVAPVAQGPAPPALAWERWTCVDDFAGSSPDAPHFTLDRLSGTVAFGDGVHGRMAPPGANNLRARRYQTGGGRRGNVAAGSITQLRTTIPSVELAGNPAPAAGGRDTEEEDAQRRAARSWLRHRNRAVARDDYVDLALQASPEVARAACVACADLAADPLGEHSAPGVVSVVIVAHGSDERPQAARAVLQQVKQFLGERCPAGVELIVLGPLYAAFGVEADLALAPGRARTEVAARCVDALRGFLHPLTGGGGGGWEFGARPHESDCYRVLEAVDGVDHIRSLRLRAVPDLPGLLESCLFVACSGEHLIRAGDGGP